MANKNENKSPNVPPLRFPEFSGEWKKVRFGEIGKGFDYGMNAPAKAFDGKNTYIRITDIDEESSRFIDEKRVSPDGKLEDAYRVRDNDILLARTGASTGKSYLYASSDGVLYFAGFLIRVNIPLNNAYFVFSQLHTSRYWRWVNLMSARSGQPGINSQEYSTYPLYLSTEKEANKIAKLLSLIDERIAIQSRMIEKLKSLIGGIVTNLSSKSCKWTYLSDVLKERLETNVNGYEICSVSVAKGVINQIDYLGRSFAAKDTSNYHIVHYDDIVYTKSPTGEFPYGIIKRSNIAAKVAVSPLYGVYIPLNHYVSTYLHNYFYSSLNTKNYLHSLIQKGAKNTINITNQRFLENKIKIPNAEIFPRVAIALDTISDKIRLEEQALDALNKQKRYLLGQMFI